MTSGPETSYRVRGGGPLHGTVFIQGAKNAALKMIAASLLTANGRTVLRNVPPIEDVRSRPGILCMRPAGSGFYLITTHALVREVPAAAHR